MYGFADDDKSVEQELYLNNLIKNKIGDEGYNSNVRGKNMSLENKLSYYKDKLMPYKYPKAKTITYKSCTKQKPCQNSPTWFFNWLFIDFDILKTTRIWSRHPWHEPSA